MTAPAARMFGTIAITASSSDLYNSTNMNMMTRNTKPSVRICDRYRLCSTLL